LNAHPRSTWFSCGNCLVKTGILNWTISLLIASNIAPSSVEVLIRRQVRLFAVPVKEQPKNARQAGGRQAGQAAFNDANLPVKPT
jgi:hypothetical protein